MKEEILRRQDIFKAFVEKEIYNNMPAETYTIDIHSIVENIMTLYKADIQSIVNLKEK